MLIRRSCWSRLCRWATSMFRVSGPRHTPQMDTAPWLAWEHRTGEFTAVDAAGMGGHDLPWQDGTDARAKAANERLVNGTSAAPQSWRGKDGR